MHGCRRARNPGYRRSLQIPQVVIRASRDGRRPEAGTGAVEIIGDVQALPWVIDGSGRGILSFDLSRGGKIGKIGKIGIFYYVFNALTIVSFFLSDLSATRGIGKIGKIAGVNATLDPAYLARLGHLEQENIRRVA